MSDKAQVFLAPHLRNAAVTRAVTHERAKTGSWAPAPFSKPAKAPGRSIAGARRGLEGAETPQPVTVSFTLAEAVAAVSAFLAAADHALVSAARYEVGEMEEKAQRMYARACMLEYLAETMAKAARNSG